MDGPGRYRPKYKAAMEAKGINMSRFLMIIPVGFFVDTATIFNCVISFIMFWEFMFLFLYNHKHIDPGVDNAYWLLFDQRSALVRAFTVVSSTYLLRIKG